MNRPAPILRLAVTGYVSEQAGSVASANALLLKALLERGCEVVFFSKASFVDPRPAVGDSPRFRFVDTDNRFFDRLRTRLAKLPLVGFLAERADSATYNRLVVKTIQREHAKQPFDLALWLGEFSKGRIPGISTVSYVQGPPGTDARSIFDRFDEIAALAGSQLAWRWKLLAALRLSAFGLPPIRHTDHFIVGSNQSRQTLQHRYGVPEEVISVLPYPIDLELFRPSPIVPSPSLRALWLGRIIPRKRLDLFLNGAAEAIRRGVDLRLTIIGGVGFIPGYDALIARFPFPDRLTWQTSIPREEVPALMACHDLLVQPSDEENFGSSVAEAQACGLPVIVGRTNGNADYLCERDLHLADDRPETLADAFAVMAARKGDDPTPSRQCAERAFGLDCVTAVLLGILQKVSHQKVTIVMPSGSYRGGAEEALLHLAQARVGSGLDLSVIVLEPGDLAERIAAEGVPVETIDAGRLRDGLRFIRTISRIRQNLKRNQPDLVLSWMTKGHLYSGIAARLAGIPAAYFQMGLPDGSVVDHLCRWIPAIGAIGCSEFVAKEQQRQVAYPVLSVPLAADHEKFAAAESVTVAEMKTRLGFDPAKPLVGIVGRLQTWKGMHVFAEAIALVVKEVPECQAVIVGGEHYLEPDYVAFLQETIADLELTETIRLAGSQQNIPEWMQAMDVIVHASEREPFGIVVVEAITLGKPVIATRPGGPEEIVRDGVDGVLVPFGKPAPMAEAMLRFLKDPHFAASCGASAKARSQEFTREKFAKNLAAALARLTRESGIVAVCKQG